MTIFRFLTFNLWYGKNWKKEIDLIKSQNPDIFVLQEVTKNIPKFGLNNIDVFHEFENAFPDFKGIIAPITYKKEKGKEIFFGNAIFSKFSVISSNIHYYLKPLDWTDDYERQSRNLVEAKVKINGQELYVFTTHFTYSPAFADTPIKVKEAEKVIEIIKDKQPMIIAGDFNSHFKSEVIKKIDKEVLYIDREHNPTWTKHPFSYKGFEETELKWKLDYIFISERLKCKSFKIIDTDISDHLPIVAELELN